VGLVDFYGEDLADQGRGAVEDYDLVVLGAGGELVGTVDAAGAFDEDFEGLADELMVEIVGDFVLQGEEVVVAETFGLLGDVVGVTLGGEGAGTGGVFEDETVFVLGLLEELAGEVVVLFGFGGEADDEVARKLNVGEEGAGAG